MSVEKNFSENPPGPTESAPEKKEEFTREEWNQLTELDGLLYGQLLLQGKEKIKEVLALVEKAVRIYGKEEYKKILQEKLRVKKEASEREKKF